MRDIFEVKDRDDKIFKVLKCIQVGIVIALALFAAVLLITLVFGGLFFDLDAALVGNWFSTVVVIVFVLAFIVELVLFIVWLLAYPPFVLLALLGALLLVFVGALFVWICGEPIEGISSLLQPIFEFMK